MNNIINILGLNFDKFSLYSGAFVGCVIALMVTFIIRKIISRRKDKESFSQIKEKLQMAYEGNRQSANIINDLYSMFEEIEKEAQSLK